MKDDSNFPRLTVGGYICPECRKAFQEEPKLWQHAKDSHRETFEFRGSIGEAVARKHFREEANVGPTESEVSKPPINMYLAAVSDDYKCQYLGQKIHGSQRPTARYFCPLCREAFQQESKLWQHALNVHPEYLESLMGDTEPTGEAEAEARKQLCREATPMEPAVSKTTSKDDDSTRPNIEDDDPTGNFLLDAREPRSSSHHPLKRRAEGEYDSPKPSSDEHSVGKMTSKARHAKVQSGGPFVDKDPHFDREALVPSDSAFQRNAVGSIKRLFDPNTDNPSALLVGRNKDQEHTSSTRRISDFRALVFRSKKIESEGKDDSLPKLEYGEGDYIQEQLRYNDKPHGNARSNASRAPLDESASADQIHETNLEPEPTMIPQPETRPIFVDQLFAELRGIQTGLDMVEAKCIEVDERQSVAAQEKDSSRKNKLSNDQWQALIALHKQLLHEHHDFFLVSQHPSASPALSRLAARFSMPARLWRHGIHAFLEVLRHRLPESLDHMLAFIYIAYSLMTLLYETVTTFEDTWIECLGDLARYRMAIEDDDIRDREVWNGVARFWYSKAADKSPNVGRLYHHLAILARPSSLQQLSLFTKSLTCVTPFESARDSIMTLFTPILKGKNSACYRLSSLENDFIKAHGILFSGGPLDEFDNAVQQLKDGLLDNYIGRVTAKFKEQGVFAAVINIAALFEYGALKQPHLHKSIFRLAFEEVGFQRNQQTNPPSTHPSAEYFDVNDDATHRSSPASANPSAFDNLIGSDIETSKVVISRASSIAFTTLTISLLRIGDKNVFPLIHVSFVFLWSLVIIGKAMKYVERDVPWGEICSFLNSLAKPETMTPRVWGEGFPKPNGDVGRPLPEDFVLRGQIYSQSYFPKNWFQEARIDDEERALELPSMTALRVERILWLGIRVASFDRWIRFDKESYKFVITKSRRQAEHTCN